MNPEALGERFFFSTMVVSLRNSKASQNLTHSKAGFAAGTLQDIALYPIDTIKHRMQSNVGLWKSGGFRGIYKGLSTAAFGGSGPAGALFFCTYETSKHYLHSKSDNKEDFIAISIVSATIAEIVACVIRVPIENAKTRRWGYSKACDECRDYIFQCQVQRDGPRRSLYRGFATRTVSHIPFAFIQVPIWDYLRALFSDQDHENSLDTLISIKVALCGALSSAITAVITTPLDLAVSHAMQCPKKANKPQFVFSILKDLYMVRGFRR